MTPTRNVWLYVVIAATILMVTMGMRQSLGLFMSPLNTHTGLGIASISLAMAIGQFVWGAMQPVFGAMADRTVGAIMQLPGGGRLLRIAFLFVAGDHRDFRNPPV